MERVEARQRQQTRCTGCSQMVPSYDFVNVGSAEKGYQALCGKCFNTEMAKRGGLNGFEHVTFDPVELVDCTGEGHEFIFELICSVPEWLSTRSSFGARVTRPAINSR